MLGLLQLLYTSTSFFPWKMVGLTRQIAKLNTNVRKTTTYTPCLKKTPRTFSILTWTKLSDCHNF